MKILHLLDMGEYVSFQLDDYGYVDILWDAIADEIYKQAKVKEFSASPQDGDWDYRILLNPARPEGVSVLVYDLNKLEYKVPFIDLTDVFRRKLEDLNIYPV